MKYGKKYAPDMESLPLYIIAALALIVTPGPDVIYVLSRGIADGRVGGLMSALGVTCGILIHTLAASLGLAVLLQTSAIGFWILKLAGGVYLVYLGIQVIKNKKAFDLYINREGINIKKCFVQGFLSNVLNPKVALFFVAFLPQFVDLNSPHYSAHMIGLGLIYAVMTILFLSILGIFSGIIGVWLKSKRSVTGKVRWVSGLVLMVLGVRLLAFQRN
jgi:threonine/homoserine/homoserine lactone efflux protein